MLPNCGEIFFRTPCPQQRNYQNSLWIPNVFQVYYWEDQESSTANLSGMDSTASALWIPFNGYVEST
jgi:hypothetical protein